MRGVCGMGCPPHRWAVFEEYRNVVKYICKDCRVTTIKLKEVKQNGKNKELGQKN